MPAFEIQIRRQETNVLPPRVDSELSVQRRAVPCLQTSFNPPLRKNRDKSKKFNIDLPLHSRPFTSTDALTILCFLPSPLLITGTLKGTHFTIFAPFI